MSYIVWHPGSGTIISADEACLVDIDSLPGDPCDIDEWEDYLNTYGATVYAVAKGKELL